MFTWNTPMAEASSPDADRAFPDPSAYLPEWVVHLLAWLILFLREHGPAAGHRRTRGVPSWFHARPNLPPGSAQALAAPVRGAFGRAIAWMCRRRSIDPGHPHRPELASTIAAFGGSVHGFRAGLPPCGLQWWKNSGDRAQHDRHDRAGATVMRLSPKNDFHAPSPVLAVAPAAAAPTAVRPAMPVEPRDHRRHHRHGRSDLGCRRDDNASLAEE